MLSIFPFLFTFSALAPIILRAGLGAVLIVTGHSRVKGKSKSEKIIGYAQKLSALFLIVGLFLQIASILLAIIAIHDLFIKKRKDMEVNILILAISLALLALGPGLLAFDLPF